MAPRTASLVTYRSTPTERAHFAIFVPSATDDGQRTLIDVVGFPMAGFSLEFKRNYNPAATQRPHMMYRIGHR
ncbi:hypothetical protein EMCG_00171 [[Emmonsia] crescens]|uniref:Uncharacterized protein n=1 Tax=[Emmonsia] crescens TaxID=73230 RepID=A0A0G2ICN4_9EURO|nr:hypothetical protein EMCG_00171 [Emmonsia crescens UAMH 3008]